MNQTENTIKIVHDTYCRYKLFSSSIFVLNVLYVLPYGLCEWTPIKTLELFLSHIRWLSMPMQACKSSAWHLLCLQLGEERSLLTACRKKRVQWIAWTYSSVENFHCGACINSSEIRCHLSLFLDTLVVGRHLIVSV